MYDDQLCSVLNVLQEDIGRRNAPDETSALESYYLMAHNPPRATDTLVNTPHPAWNDDSTFHMSQVCLSSFS